MRRSATCRFFADQNGQQLRTQSRGGGHKLRRTLTAWRNVTTKAKQADARAPEPPRPEPNESSDRLDAFSFGWTEEEVVLREGWNGQRYF
jgi:hypothetical protein